MSDVMTSTSNLRLSVILFVKVFFHKMEGDYHRYLAEFQTGDVRKQSADKALQAYEVATECSRANMSTTHPIRLGLALNFSVFYYEIKNEPDRACSLAKQVRLSPRLSARLPCDALCSRYATSSMHHEGTVVCWC